MESQKTPEDIIKEITDACEGKRCIFRGESEKNGIPVSSGFYRMFFADRELQNYKERSAFIIEGYTEQIVKDARRHCAPGISDIDILAQIQHYGGKTTLIDFTYSYLIALFFACSGHQRKNGKLYIYKIGEFSQIDLEQSHLARNITDIIKNQDYLINPSSKEPRVIFQSSVFIYAHKGFLNAGRKRCINIPKGQKRKILEYLYQNFDITAKTIYNDIHGFIKNQDNYIMAKVEISKGIICYRKKEYYKAMQRYNNAMKINPQDAVAYNNRAGIKRYLKKLDGAIEDCDKAIEISPQFATAYNSRGTAKQDKYISGENKDDLNGAIRDYNKAIELDPQFVEAYNHRGTARLARDIKGAIRDYNKAIEIDRQYAAAYCNRGIARWKKSKQIKDEQAKRGLEEDAIQDLEQAKKLAEQQGRQELLDFVINKLNELKAQREN